MRRLYRHIGPQALRECSGAWEALSAKVQSAAFSYLGMEVIQVCVCARCRTGVFSTTYLPAYQCCEWGAFHHLAPLWQCTRIFFLFLCFCVLFVLFGLIAAGWLHVGGASTQRDTGHCEACTLTGEGPQEGIHAIVTVVYKTS